MSRFPNRLGGVVGLGMAIGAAWGQEPNPFKLSGVHPGYSVTNLLNATNYGLSTDRVKGMPNVGAMCWLTNGDLFVATQAVDGNVGNMLGPSNAYVFSGVQGNAANITIKQVASGFYEPSGCEEINGSVYVVDNKNGIVKLTPSTSSTWASASIYKGLLGEMTCGGSGDRRWDAGLIHINGFLYSSVGMGLIPGGTSETGENVCRGRGTVLKIPLAGGSADTLSGGVRNSGGMALGPDNEIFLTDNQGGWKPASPIYNARQGKWFGHPDTPLGPNGTASKDVDPPVVIFPYGSSTSSSPATDPALARSPTGLVMIKKGMYAGQMLVGEVYLGGINRVFLEKVKGNYQGVIFPFSQGLGTASAAGASGFSSPINRLLIGSDDSTIYLGGGGGEGTTGNWGVANRNHWGLARMTPNGATTFEMRAIRSISSTQMEVEFTEPVTAVAASNFTVHQWNYTVGGSANNGSYGAGKNATTQLTVSAATLDASKTKATVTITGLKELPASPGRTWPSVVQIRVSGVAAASGHTLWGGQAWYTLSKFGPADAPVSTSPQFNQNGVPVKLTARWNGATLRVSFPVQGAYELRVIDTQGRILTRLHAHGQTEFALPASTLNPGLNILEATSAQGQWRTVIAGVTEQN